MVHSDGPQCADTTAVAGQESTAGQRFLIGDSSLGWNPSSPATVSAWLTPLRLWGPHLTPQPAAGHGYETTRSSLAPRPGPSCALPRSTRSASSPAPE